MRIVDTLYTTLVWSSDNRVVTKHRKKSATARSRFTNEARINQLLVRQRPPVPTPRLLGVDWRAEALTFEAIDGTPVGPKYPEGLAAERVEDLIGLAAMMARYRPPRRRWYRRVNSVARLHLAHRHRLLTDRQHHALTALAQKIHRRVHFAHGDLTARNVLEAEHGLFLIDWEWAGLHPPAYDLGFLWHALGHIDGARAKVEAATSSDPRAMWLSALLIELWHLQWFTPAAFRPAHLTSRDDLLDRLLPTT